MSPRNTSTIFTRKKSTQGTPPAPIWQGSFVDNPQLIAAPWRVCAIAPLMMMMSMGMELLLPAGCTTAGDGDGDVAPGRIPAILIIPPATVTAAAEASIVGEFLQDVAVPETVVVVVVRWGGGVAVSRASAAEDSGQVLFQWDPEDG